MGKTYDKIMAAKQKAATQEGWANAAGAVAGAVGSYYKQQADADANEQALSALHPELAGKGLGAALARNPSLSRSLLEPTIEAQSRSALQASEYELAGKNAAASDERRAGYDAANDERTRQREIELERMREEADKGRYAQEHDPNTILGDEAARHGMSPEAWAEHLMQKDEQAKAESEANIEHFKAGTAESELKRKAVEREMQPVTEPYDPELPPRIYQPLQKSGATRADIERAKARYRESEHDRMLAENYKSQAEGRDAREEQAKADLEFKKQKAALDRNLELKKINATNFRSVLNNPLALQALRSDPEMKDNFSKSLGKGFDEWLATQPAEPSSGEPEGGAPPASAVDRKQEYTEKYRPQITDARWLKAFDKQTERIDGLNQKLSNAQKLGLTKQEIADLQSQIEKAVESLRTIAASGSKE